MVCRRSVSLLSKNSIFVRVLQRQETTRHWVSEVIRRLTLVDLCTWRRTKGGEVTLKETGEKKDTPLVHDRPVRETFWSTTFPEGSYVWTVSWWVYFE